MTTALIFAAVRLLTAMADTLAPCAGLEWPAWRTCQGVAAAARAEGVPVRLATALAWSESRFDADAANPSGALGPMQVKPQFWCLGGDADGCDLTRAGVVALRQLVDRHGVEGGLCHYAAGNVCTTAGRRYARHVLRMARDGWQR